MSDNPLILARAALNQPVIVVATHSGSSKTHTHSKQTVQTVKKKLEFERPVDPQQALRNRQTGHAKGHYAKFRLEEGCFHPRSCQESSKGMFKQSLLSKLRSMPHQIKTKEWNLEIRRCQGKFAENRIYFDKFKEPCGYLGSRETVLSVTFVTCKILDPFERKSETRFI